MSFGIAQAIRDAGFDLRVLTGIPNYPAGRPAPGYRAWRRYREQVRGLETLRVPLYPYHGPAAARRVLNYVSFGLSAATLGARLLRGSDVNFVISSPATNDMAAYAHRLLAGPPYVLYVQDLWPDSIFATGYLTGGGASRSEAILRRMVDVTYAGASRLLVISDGMKTELVRRGIAEDRVEVLYNWADEAVFRPEGPRSNLREDLRVGRDELVFLYSGNLGLAQGLDHWVQAFAEDAVPDNAHLVLQGRGSESDRLRELAGSHPRVHFLSPTDDRRAAIANMRAADALVVSLRDHRLFEMTVPSKLLGALAAARPVVATLPGDAAELIRTSGAGFVAPPGSVDAVAQVVTLASGEGREAIESRGLNGRLHYDSRLSREHALRQLSTAITTAVSEGVRR